MKYIRTKDGIFDIEKYGGIRTIVKLYDVDESLRIKYENTNEPQQVGDRIVIVENKDYKITNNNNADTVEELCDRFVLNGIDIIFLNKEHTQYRFEGDDEWSDITETELRIGIYGAIWTDKSLQFVARMNSKGEFELL